MSSPASAAPRRAADPPDGGLLVEGLRRGDGEALDRAFALHKDRLFGFLFRLAGRRDLAEDLLQETFVQLARHALRLAPDTNLSAWLFTVARNAWRGSLRHQQADDRALAELPAAEAAVADDPERATESAAALARLRAALDALTAGEREVLLVAVQDELCAAEAAAVLGIRPDAFRKRLERARAALAGRLAALEAPPAAAPVARGASPPFPASPASAGPAGSPTSAGSGSSPASAVPPAPSRRGAAP